MTGLGTQLSVTTGLAAFFLGYVLGSIPFGLLLTRFAGAGDIRKIGSGNIGATNVLRTGRKGLAIATLLADLLKGAIPVVLADYLMGHEASLIAGAGAILGHCFPAWLGFKGGKGVATAAGVVLAVTPLLMLFLIIVFVAIVWLTRFVSLGSIVVAGLAPIVAYLAGAPLAALLYLLVAALVIGKHHANIGRLMRGQENRLSFKKAA